MKKSSIITLACILLTANCLLAQQHAKFISSGTIEYEKSANMNALIKKMYSSTSLGSNSLQQAIEQYQKTQPQFKIMKSTLVFGDNKALYTPIVPDGPPNNSFSTAMSDQINTIYTDLNTNTSTVQKNIYDAVFLLKDSVRKINWKITEDTRDILGYSCRRANALVLDSIYVVAFYTDQIAIAGGPESFSGLPGAILQLAIPHENVSWIATKVTPGDIPATTLVPPKKGKVVTNKQFVDFLNSLLSGGRDPVQLAFMMKGFLL